MIALTGKLKLFFFMVKLLVGPKKDFTEKERERERGGDNWLFIRLD